MFNLLLLDFCWDLLYCTRLYLVISVVKQALPMTRNFPFA